MANIFGTSLTDVLYGTGKADTISGLAGDDYIDGLGGDDVVLGGSGFDDLDGNDGADTLGGGPGDDRLFSEATPGQPANDHMDGGVGNDVAIINWSQSPDGATFSIADPTALQSFSGSSLVNVEQVDFRGGSGDDAITGGAERDIINPGAGDAIIHGEGGSDVITINQADIERNAADHKHMLIDGGDGFDNFTIAFDSGHPVHFDFNDFATDITLASLEYNQVYLPDLYQDYDDYIALSDLNDILLGGNGDDVLLGRGGDDIVAGGDGNDTIAGGDGNDRLYGGADKDYMTGGAGSDVFVFQQDTGHLPDSRPGGGGRDVITDFQSGIDKIDVSALGITSYAQLSFKTVGSGLVIYGDVKADGFDQHDFGLQLNGVHAVTANDFIFAL